MLVETALLCLSLNIYFESRGEPVLGQIAVAQVTMNRAENNPAKVCKVVFAPKQFSWTTDKAEPVGSKYRIKPEYQPVEKEAWQRSLNLARLILDNKIRIDLKGAKYFHAIEANFPKHMRDKLVRVAVIGKHIFYTYA